MADTPNTSARAMRSLCADIESAIGRGELPHEAVADLKLAIDETRLRVWASMEAARSGDPSWVQEFWLRRAAEVCSTMLVRLAEGQLDPRSAKAEHLRAAAERLAAALAVGSD
jgi:hypothetical protein